MKIKSLATKDLRAFKPAEIEKHIAELENSFKEFTLAVATNKEKQTHKSSVIKKSIARAKSILTEQAKLEKEK